MEKEIERLRGEVEIKINDFFIAPDRNKIDAIIKFLAQLLSDFDEERKNKLKIDKAKIKGVFKESIILEQVDEGGGKIKVYNKLVRDKIVDYLSGLGFKCDSHVAKGEEFKDALQKKVSEELNEFFDKPCEEELADVEEVLEAWLATSEI